MRLFCPNLSDPDYKRLVDLHGEVRAAAIYARYNNDGVVPEIYYKQGVILKSDSENIRNNFGSERGFNQAVDILSTAFVSGMSGHTDSRESMLLRAKELLGGTEVKSKEVRSEEVKSGVAELFESNPELANAVYKALGFEQNNIEEFKGFWNRNQVASQTDKIFLFGDNTNDRTVTKYVPSTTQAVIRGLPNAVGIDTKKDRGTSVNSYMTDADFDWFKNHVDSQIQKAKSSGKTIVIPADGIGTGKAMLKEKAPKLFEYLQQELDKLKESQITPQQKQLANAVYEALGFKTDKKGLVELTHYSRNNQNPLDKFQEDFPLYTSRGESSEYKDYGKQFNFIVKKEANIKSLLDFHGKYGIDLDKHDEASKGLQPYHFNLQEIQAIRKEGVDILIDDWGEYIILNPNSVVLKEKQKQQAQQLYSQYLDTIFPDSKVKDIVYRGDKSKTTNGFLQFLEGERKEMLFLSTNENVAKSDLYYSDFSEFIYTKDESGNLTITTEREPNESKNLVRGPKNFIAAIVDIKSPLTVDAKNQRYDEYEIDGKDEYTIVKEVRNDSSKDSLLIENVIESGSNSIPSTTVGIKDPKQIHRLGDEQDIKKFREFVESEVKELSVKPDQSGGLIYDAIAELRDYLEEYDPETSEDYVNPLLNIDLKLLNEDQLDNTYTALDNILSNWNDELADPKSDTIIKGFRSHTIDALKSFGYSITKSYIPAEGQVVQNVLDEDLEQDQNPDEEDEPSDTDVEDDVSMAEKNYSITNLQVDPATTVSQEVKRLLQDVISPIPNMYGFRTNIPITRIMGKIKSKVKNVTSFNDMQTKLIEAAKYDEELKSIVDALNRFSTPQKAQFFKTFRLDETKLIIIEESYNQEDSIDEEGYIEVKDGKTVKVLEKTTTIIGINREDTAAKLRSSWLENIQSGEQTKNNPIVYVITKDSGEYANLDGNDNVVYNVRNPISKTEYIQKAFSALQGTSLSEKSKALGGIMWELGMNIGNSRAQNEDIIQEYIMSKGSDAAGFIAQVLDKGDVVGIIKDIFNVRLVGGRITDIQSAKSDLVKDYSIGRISNINYLANAFADLYKSDVVDSVLNGKGKPVYPVNKPTPLTDRVNDMNSDTRSQTYIDMEQDASLNPSREHRSLMFGIMESSEMGYFKVQTEQFSAVRAEEAESSEAVEYKELKERGLIKTSLDLFLMDGSSTMRVQIPTQESRENLAYITLPKFDDFSVKSQLTQIYKDTGMSKKSIITSIIIQDLVRINRDSKINKEFPQGGFKDYHDRIDRIKQMRLTGTEDVSVVGTNLSDMVLGMLEYGRNSVYAPYWNAIDQMVDTYLNETLPQYTQEFLDKLASINITEQSVDANGLRRGYQGNFNAFIESYVFNTIIARLELTSLFRGSHAYFKNIEDLYKRWGLLNTPGSKAFIKGSDPNNPEYGMFETFSQASFEDLGTEGEVTEKLADMYADKLREQRLSEERIKAITKTFRSNVAKGTDALAIISPEMFRALIQGGFGPFVWTAEHEEMYQRYKEGGKWEFEFTPQFKPFYDHTGIVEVGGQKIYASELDKNAFFVLTRDVASKAPIMEDMYRAMNGAYTNGEPIHLFNAVSAKKGIKRKVFIIDRSKAERGETDYFKGIEPTIQYGRSFVEPQVMSAKDKSEVRFNRQIRRHVVSNINRAENYEFRGETVTGEDVFNVYGKALKAKVTKTLKDALEEVGYRDYISAQTEEERKTAKLKMLSKIKELTIDSKRNSGQLDIVLEDQLQIVKVSNGEYDFELPVSFPTSERELIAQFLGLFRSRVAKIMVPGVELVQAGAMGNFNINGEFRELRFIDAESEDKLYVEIALSEDVLEKLGIQIGDELDLSDPAIQEKLILLGYRIPHQSLASTLVLKPVVTLPKSYKKSIIVPANFTVVTGSDFDWDKLYVIMQDLDADGNIAFPDTSVKNLANQPSEYYEGLDEAQLNNLLFYSQVAVSQNFKHLEEVLSGVESEEYKRIADRLNELEGSQLDSTSRLDDPLLDVKMYNKFMTAAGLVGQYSNADSGFSVAVHGKNLGDGSYGLRINQSAKVSWVAGGEVLELDTIRSISIVNGERVNKIFTSHNSASLDVGGQENPLQDRTNDNALTANATIHLGSVGVPQEGVIAFRMQPLVRDFVRRVNASKASPNQVFKEMGKELGLKGNVVQNIIDGVNKPMSPMGQEDLELVIGSQDRTSELAKSLFRNFIISYYAGKELRKVYKKLSPDTLDGVNDLGEMQVIADTGNALKAKSNPIVSAEDINQFLEGDAFLPTQAFQEYFTVVFNASKPLFFSPSDSVLMFKEYLKNILGIEELNGAQHRAINRALAYSVLSRPGSKFNQLFLSKNPEGQFTGLDPRQLVDAKIWSRSVIGKLNSMVTKYPNLLSNTFIDSLENASSKSPEARIVKLEFKPKGRVDAEMSNRISEGLMSLISNPGRYNPLKENMTDKELVEREKGNLEIAEFGYALMQYAFVSSGFIPSKSSFYKFIRPELLKELGILDEFREDVNKAMNDMNYFTSSDYIIEFVRNFGLSIGLVQKRKMYRSTEGEKEVYEGKSYDVYKVFSPVSETPMFYKSYRRVPKNKRGIEDATVLFMKIGGNGEATKYIKVTPKGIKNRVVEMNFNIPEVEGTIVRGRDGMQKIAGALHEQFKDYLNASAISDMYSSQNSMLDKYGINCKF